MAHRFHDVARPGLPLGADHGGALSDPAQRLPQIPAATDKGHLEGVLPDVMGFVGGGQYLRLVDVVDAQGLEHLGFDEVADAALCHDRDGDGLHDALDAAGVGHAGHAPGRADVRGHPL